MDASSRVAKDVADCRALSLDALPTRPAHETVLLVEPTHFDLAYAFNPHMAGDVDRERAREQWERLREALKGRRGRARARPRRDRRDARRRGARPGRPLAGVDHRLYRRLSSVRTARS